MIPSPDQLKAIANLRQGHLDRVPFAVLLHAFAVYQRTGVLEIERGPLKKTIFFEDGHPVDCRSNLLHETLGRFLVARGKITEQQMQECLQKSIAQGIRFGEVMILEELINAADLYKYLQQSLAKKLLDGFTWRTGEFRLVDGEADSESSIKVNAAQLVITGISKFALDEEVNGAVGSLVGKRLFLHPDPPHALDDLHLSSPQRELVRLLASGRRIDELASATSIPFDQIMRLLYSLAVIGVVVPEDRMPKDAVVKNVEPLPPAGSAAMVPSATPAIDVEKARNEVLGLFLRYRTLDAFDLLGVPETGKLEMIHKRYLEFSRRFAPWQFETPELSSLVEKAEALFVAGGTAFGELCDSERRNALVARRKNLRLERDRKHTADRFLIKSNLLDSELQFKKGKALMQAGKYREAVAQLQFAYDCDPQNSTYRAELAYCRYFVHPERDAERSLAEIKEVLRIDPKCSLAVFYMGDLLRELGDLDEAEPYLQRSIKLLMPDRRPIESLKALQAAQNKKKKLFGGG